ncbi:MAG TPA: hypothetical protein VMC84_04265 [Methanocella sp.]|uniref:hypothetical protein n=1 Tax=Methanocella sp. TaxID=2052833 RepID=UPI002B66F6F9|nr:hypothetical protein [Methanocella sp.]HTY90370.1 hypothetical protein [Methanocella sp.]
MCASQTLIERQAMAAPNRDILKDSRIPATIRIGVTGHRKLTDSQAILVSDCMRQILDTLDKWLTENLHNSPHTFVVISPLAEGSDRIVAWEVLDWAKADPEYKPKLEVILPFPEEEYKKDFTGRSSYEEFKILLGRARSVKILDTMRPATEAYVPVGRYVVHASDVLIVVWNGQPPCGKGGTGDILEYARNLGQSLFIINIATGEITEEWNKDWVYDSLKYLDVFNGEHLNAKTFEEYVDRRFESLEKKSEKAGLPRERLLPMKEDLLPKYARASLLAKRYQAYYNWAGALIYLFSALAVIAVAIQTLFIPGPPYYLIWVEFFIILCVLILLWGLEHFKIHRNWIDYRFLAERLRIAIFLSTAGIEFTPLKYPPYFTISQQSDYWIVKAFGWTLNSRQKLSSDVPFEASKKFLLEAWVDDQLSFYSSKYEKNKHRMEVLDLTGYAMFIATLIASFMHASELEELLPEFLANANYLTFIGIVFPTVGALLVGFQLHREYKRNAERYSQMIAPLFSISQQMRLAGDRETLGKLLERANDLMLKENQDWRVSILSQKIGV